MLLLTSVDTANLQPKTLQREVYYPKLTNMYSTTPTRSRQLGSEKRLDLFPQSSEVQHYTSILPRTYLLVRQHTSTSLENWCVSVRQEGQNAAMT